MTNIVRYEEKINDVNESLNRLKQNDDFKKFFDFYTIENRNYIASMISSHSVGQSGFNNLILELQSISDFEIYVNNFEQLLKNIKDKNAETYDPNAGVL